MGAVPLWLEDVFIDFFVAKGTAVITNVPGPQTQLYLAGVPINTVMAWVPPAGKIGLGISVISYNGQVRLGVATDSDLVPDPEIIISFFIDQYKEMLSRAKIVQSEKQENLLPMLSVLNKSLSTLDALLDQLGKDEEA